MIVTISSISHIFVVLASITCFFPLTISASLPCTCYLISGPSPGYFQHHLFWDFRNVPSEADNDFTIAPPLVTTQQDHGREEVTSSFFHSLVWERDWTIQTWAQDVTPANPIKSVNSPQNLYISRNTTDGAGDSTYLTLRTSRLQTFMSIAEIDLNQIDIMHSSLRAKLRVIPNDLANPTAAQQNTASASASADDEVASGAVVGLFTYASSTSEADIEILTRDPSSRIRYTNQPDYDAATDTSLPGASTDAVLPDHSRYTEWLTHRLDWLPMFTRFWVDEEIVLGKQVNVPRQPSGVILNLWGDGGVWSGNMTVGESVTVGVEWMELVYNVSGPSTSGSCEVGCQIDGVAKIGVPEMVFNATGSGSGAARVGYSTFEVVSGFFIAIAGCSLL